MRTPSVAWPRECCRQGSASRRNAAFLIFLALTFWLLSACSTVNLTRAEGDRTPHVIEHHFGYVRIERDRAPPLLADREQVTSFGLWVQQGIGLGFRRQDAVYLPESCRVVFFIDNEALLTRTLSLIREQSGTEGLCAVEGQDFY